MMPIFLVSREKFIYEAQNHCLGECLVHTFVHSQSHRFFVVFTELRSNKGPSVTNAMEFLTKQFLESKNLSKEEVYFYEHYEGRPGIDRVILANRSVRWRPATSAVSRAISRNITV